MKSAVMDKMASKKVNDMAIYAELTHYVERLGRLPINCGTVLTEDVVKLVADAYREGWKDGTTFVTDAIDEINEERANDRS